MPSKPLTALILVLLIAGIFGYSKLDGKRDVPWLPARLVALMPGGAPGTPVAAAPDAAVVPPAGGGAAQVPAAQPPPGGEVQDPDDPATALKGPPDPPRADEGKFIRLERIVPMTPVPEDDSAIILKISADGSSFRWAGFDPGSLKMVAKLARERAVEAPDTRVVVVPDEQTPWQFVYWAFEILRAAGFTDTAIGVLPEGEMRGRLAMLLLPVSKETYVENPDAPEIKVTVARNAAGKPVYTLNGKECVTRQDLYKAAGETNSEYAELVDGDYAKDPGKTPWLFIAPPDITAGEAVRGLAAIRMAAVYSYRLGGEFTANPGLGE